MAKKTVDLTALATAAQEALEELLAALNVQGHIVLEEEEVEEDDDDLEDEDEADEDEDDEEDEDEEVEVLDREETEALGIKELRTLAKEYLGDDAPTKKADILEALEEFYDEDEADDDDEDDLEDDEDEEEADEEDDEDVEELDEDALNAMSHRELVALCREIGVKVPAKFKTAGKGAAAKKTKAGLVELILDSADEEE